MSDINEEIMALLKKHNMKKQASSKNWLKLKELI